MLSLVNDILDFSKIEAGKMDLVPVDFDLLKLLTDLIRIGQQYCEKKKLKFNVEINEDMPFLIRFDELRLKQILTNILSNAAKYTEKGSITFTLDFEKIDENYEYLTIHVKDTGIGVKAEDQKKLFEEFERFDEIKNRSIQGTGLGLSIVQRLLAKADSKLQFVSEYGVGSDFFFTIKVSVVHWGTVRSHKSVYNRLLQEKPLYHESFIAPSARILLVDDIEVNRFVFKSLLKKTEVDITEASGGVEAVSLCNEYEFDIIFMDHLMPDLDGIETLHAIRKLNKSWVKTVPVIALTANAISGARNLYLEEGFIDYLSKPILPNHLEKKIIQYLPKDKVKLVEKDEKKKTTDSNLLIAGSSQDTGTYITDLTDINLIAGLNFCGDFKTLTQALIKFVEGIPGNLEKLKSAMDRKSRNDFIIIVHSLKSTSRAIGASQLSRFAEILEKEGKSGNVESIIENAPVFAANLSVIYEKLNPLIDYLKNSSFEKEVSDKDHTEIEPPKSNIPTAPEINPFRSREDEVNPIEKIGKVEKLSYNEMTESMIVLLHKAEEFDLDACEKLVDFLMAQSGTSDMKKTLVSIKAALDDIDWDLVQQLITDYNIKHSLL